MAEVGLVTCASVALRVGQAALPADRSKVSKPRFRPPQLLAVLCRRRDAEWTFREAEVRLAEHAERRAALGLRHGPDSTTVYRVLRRLHEAVLEQSVSAVIPRLVPQPDRQATGAVDATGLAPGAIRPFVVKRAKARGEGVTWRHGRKWTMAVEVDRHRILAHTAPRGPTHAGAMRRPLVDAAQQRGPSGVVLADAECASERHQPPRRQVLPAHRVIPAKRGGAAWPSHGVRAPRRQHVPGHLSRRRSLVERIISAVNRQLSARAPGRSLLTPCLQAWLLGVADHIDRL